METCILRKKATMFSLVLLILIGMIFLFNVSSVLAAKVHEVKSVYTYMDSDLIPADLPKNLLISTENTQIIRPTNDVMIIPPNGSIITHISRTSADIQLTNVKETTIYFSDTVDSLSKISFQKSIDGLDDFNLRINFDGYLNALDVKSATIVDYAIDWGNGDSTRGNYIPTSTQVYTYRKEGTYPVSVKLKDDNGITYAYLKNQSFKLTTAKFIQLWVGENKETVAVSTAGIGGVALLGFALTETGKYKLLALLPLLIPMYTRIQKEDVLDQFVRGQIYGFIKANPGVHYNQIMRNLDMKNGTLSYHLHMLEKTGMIKSRKERLRYRAFYPTGMKFPEKERYRLTELQMGIIETIRENEGINQREIAKKLNEKHQTINYNVKVLQQVGLIRLRRVGRKTSCFISEDTSNQDT